ncbi:hypothetical protein COCOBI_08-2340 [Coccomyxa sp. Obi]|nr:hypothetical protein COCOBI_08-2340 [Coccomyxa sp. Obi]
MRSRTIVQVVSLEPPPSISEPAACTRLAAGRLIKQLKFPKIRMDPEAQEAEQINRKLQAHGEAFMSMFDDSEDEAAAQHDPEIVQQAVSAKADHAEVNVMATSSGREEEGSSGELDFLTSKASKQRNTAISGGDADESILSLRKQKRLILSGKSLLQQPADSRLPRQKQGGRTDHERDITRADFEKMRKEVDILGASALGKRQRKEFEDSMLRSVNAKLQKSPRIPASIGQGLARKRKQREEMAKELAIEAGMLQRKGLGKKRKQAEKVQKKVSKNRR